MNQKYYYHNRYKENEQYIDYNQLYQDKLIIKNITDLTLTPETIINLLMSNKKLKRKIWDNYTFAKFEFGKFIVINNNEERTLEIIELIEKDWYIIE